MQRLALHDLRTAAAGAAEPHAADAELSLLRDVLRMLPSGVTVQDEHGNLLLINTLPRRSLASVKATCKATCKAALQCRRRGISSSAATAASNCCAREDLRSSRNASTTDRRDRCCSPRTGRSVSPTAVF